MGNPLFNQTTSSEFTQSIASSVGAKINNLQKKDFESKSIEEISDSLYANSLIEIIKLELDKAYLKTPSDVWIDIGHSRRQGTRFEFVVPFTGNKQLFGVRPSQFTYNPPQGAVQSNELHFVYDTLQSSNTEEIKRAYENNLATIQIWLQNLETEINIFNSQLKTSISAHVSNRKRKIDTDSNSANSFGLPIR